LHHGWGRLASLAAGPRRVDETEVRPF